MSDEPTIATRPPYIIDTCVALKWYVPEDDTAEARLYMGHGIDRYAPDLLPIEAAHALLKRVRSRDEDWALTRDQAGLVVGILRHSAPIEYHPDPPLQEKAFDLACQIGASAYDGLFLALAIRLDGQVVTADRRFFDKIIASEYAAHGRWFLDPP